MRHFKGTRAGFTLVEMAIVLTLIGLLIGAVTLGRNMVRNSQLQSVLVDVQTYKEAMEKFRIKYGQLPGDLSNATSYWGVDGSGGVCPNITTNTVKKSATCNGDGNSRIAMWNNSATHYEYHRVWQHLANAEMIPGSYTGVAGPAGVSDSVIGVNAPAGKLPGSGFSILYWNGAETWQFFTGSSYDHAFVYGAAVSNGSPRGPLLTGSEAKTLDSKIDDGLPGMGTVFTFESSATYLPGCSTTDVPTTSLYNTTSNSELCALFFRAGF